MPEILTVLRREFIYLWYYFSVQLEQIFGGRPSFAGLAGRGMSMGAAAAFMAADPGARKLVPGTKHFAVCLALCGWFRWPSDRSSTAFLCINTNDTGKPNQTRSVPK